MKVYNKDKTELLTEFDLSNGRLVDDVVLLEIKPKLEEIAEQGHYETLKEYPNGGRDVVWVVDVPGQPARDEEYVYEDVKVYIPYTEDEKLNFLRERRETECFSVLVKYSKFWYDNLPTDRVQELKEWYEKWLDVTETKEIPTKPYWLN